MIPIEKGVPMPIKPGRNYHTKYPYRTMAVGDSFLEPLLDVNNPGRAANRIRTHVSYYKRHHNMVFEYRFVSDGIRVWRTA